MPKAYTKMRDKFAETMSYDEAQAKAARIYNSKHPGSPVGQHGHGRSDKRKGK